MKIIYDTQLILLGIYIALNALIVGYYWNRTYLAFWIAVFFFNCNMVFRFKTIWNI